MTYRALAPCCVFAVLLNIIPSAHASLTILSVVGGQPAGGANYVSFDNLPLGDNGGGVQTAVGPNGSVEITLTPNAQIVTGAASGLYAAPYISNQNGINFGDATLSGPDATHYVTTGSAGSVAAAAVKLAFSAGQQYLGLLWGSVDDYNTLTFHFTDNTTESITGVNVNTFANGDQGVNGTFYVNINSDKPFDYVTATSSQYAFEFDNLAYSTSAIPEATTIAVWTGLSLLGGIAYRRRQQFA